MEMLKKLLVVVVLFSRIAVPVDAFSEPVESEGILSDLNIEASGTFDVYSKYLWRGFTLDTDPVFQPGFSLSGYGITLSYWASYDFDNNDTADSDEIDYAIDYTKEFDGFSISVGHTYYEFPGADTFSKEFYVGLGFAGMPLSPGFTYYYDYGDETQGGGDGDYVCLSGSHSFELEKGITIDLSGQIGYNEKLFITGEGVDTLLSAGFTIPLTESLSFSPSANYAMAFGDLEDPDDGNQRDRFYCGFSLGYLF